MVLETICNVVAYIFYGLSALAVGICAMVMFLLLLLQTIKYLGSKNEPNTQADAKGGIKHAIQSFIVVFAIAGLPAILLYVLKWAIGCLGVIISILVFFIGLPIFLSIARKLGVIKRRNRDIKKPETAASDGPPKTQSGS